MHYNYCLKKHITWAPGLIQHTKWRRITSTLLQTIFISIPLKFMYCTLGKSCLVTLTTCISKDQFSFSLLYLVFVVLLSSLYKWAIEAQGLRSQVSLQCLEVWLSRELRMHYGRYSKHTSEESQLHTWEKPSCKTTGATYSILFISTPPPQPHS